VAPQVVPLFSSGVPLPLSCVTFYSALGKRVSTATTPHPFGVCSSLQLVEKLALSHPPRRIDWFCTREFKFAHSSPFHLGCGRRGINRAVQASTLRQPTTNGSQAWGESKQARLVRVFGCEPVAETLGSANHSSPVP